MSFCLKIAISVVCLKGETSKKGGGHFEMGANIFSNCYWGQLKPSFVTRVSWEYHDYKKVG